MTRRRPDPRQFAFDFSAPLPWTEERLAQVLLDQGIVTTPYCLRINYGTLQDDSVPWSPRSYSFPVSVELADGAVRLWLRTPAGGSLPFVRRVEAALGVRAVWDDSRPNIMDARWHHAIDLASEGRLEELFASREHTTDRLIARAVVLALEWGKCKPADARHAFGALGIPEPEDRSDAFLFEGGGLRPCRSVGAPNLRPTELVHCWGMLHALEDGWVAVRRGQAKVTAAYWQRVDGRLAA